MKKLCPLRKNIEVTTWNDNLSTDRNIFCRYEPGVTAAPPRGAGWMSFKDNQDGRFKAEQKFQVYIEEGNMEPAHEADFTGKRKLKAVQETAFFKHK